MEFFEYFPDEALTFLYSSTDSLNLARILFLFWRALAFSYLNGSIVALPFLYSAPLSPLIEAHLDLI